MVVQQGKAWSLVTSSFYGTQTYAIDHKGRLSVPATMRRRARGKALGEFMVVGGFEGCLELYTLEDWKRVEDRLRRVPMGDRRGRSFARAYLMHAARVTVDSQGRITIPPALLSRAGIGKEAVLHGQVGRIEIWNPERLQSVLEEAQAHMEEYADQVLGEE